MKKLYSTFCLLLLTQLAFAVTENANVKLSNLSSNSYYTGYNESTGVISGINFMVLADGSNSNYYVPEFKVKLYLYKSNSDPIFYIKTYTISDLKHMGGYTFEDIDIDLNEVDGLPAGTYRLGVHVDADDDIPNPPDKTDDNAYLLQNENGSNDIVFSGGGTQTGGNKPDLIISSVDYDFNSATGTLSNILIKIKNNGTGKAESSKIKLHFEEVGSPGNNGNVSQTIFSLNSGETTDFTPQDLDINFIFPTYNSSKTYKLVITIDADEEIDESDENNNTYTINNIANHVSTGLEEISTLGITLPNPVSKNELDRILNSSTEVLGYTLYHPSGQNITSPSTTGDLYLLNIKTRKGEYLSKIVLK
ncbi:MAG TPA: CARDB domain-containing protein [Cytophagaceae bacterium]